MRGVQITAVVENTAQGRGLLGEHGLSLWIETNSQRILFDTGQTDVLLHNANKMGIDLTSLDAMVLSHGHYDHTGGVNHVLKRTWGTKVFTHPEALTENYSGGGRYTGISEQDRKSIEQHAETVETENPVELGDGFSLTGAIPRVTDFEDTGGPFFRDAACTEEDPMNDDQAAFIDTDAGIVVILGCAHAGIINTLLYVKELLPKRPIHTVIGGTHLMAAGAERMNKTVESLREMEFAYLYPVHCTGYNASARLSKQFPRRVAPCPAGSRLELGSGKG